MNVKLNFLTALYLVAAPSSAWAVMPELDTWRDGASFHLTNGLANNQAIPDAKSLEAPVQLAQNYDFDVYIDQYGREIIVDAFTGEVVEIRPAAPGRRQDGRRPSRPREFDGQVYDFSDPREVDRYRRNRGRARNAPDDRYSDPYANAPRYDDRDAYPEDPNYGREPIERTPLDAPDARDNMAGLPDQRTGNNPGSGGAAVTPALPRDSAVVRPRGVSEDVTRFQVLLDRMGASPGVIDGRTGDNVNKAIRAYREITGQTLRTYDKEWIEAELERTGGPAFKEYTITAEDAAGPYIASVPADYAHKAQLDALSYTSVIEMLAERFHMDEKYLVALNPDANFNRAGTIIKVVNVGKPMKASVARIVADKSAKQLRAYNEDDQLVAAYPATIGSSDTPSPTGTHTVSRIALNPEYTYNPKINFKQGNNDKVLTIPPGPNGPVGSVWIALSKPTYGIHGTPDPSKIGKTASHGCIRLTNWDAEELAKRVKPGVTVTFVE
ncbi:L,D-transpeptidase family protein [Nitratireductor kimnyeongensis]|uniref:L,D-transpeptidase family protein n=1 Tax=Nitratireductor kimnyeongensis TaxID=430679 RepID=A0ABW0TCD3_9HYPH|nr:L,D-transpeptidase [Nitratireductor kimnyeongensis]QZZ36465.1 L,D-transpeptidase [Nitratireductor kimnyeongensis]